MTLLLEITDPQAAELADAARKRFVESGGTIGRLPDSDWVIPDPFISGQHARIHYRDGRYLLEDMSTNGVFINSRDHRLSKDQLYVLRDGDRVFIDNYEISVVIADQQEFTARLGGPPQQAVFPDASAPRDPLLTLPLEEPADAVIDAMMPPGFEPLHLDTELLSTPLSMPLMPPPKPAPQARAPEPKPAAAPAPAYAPTPPSAPSSSSAGKVDFTALLLAAGVPQTHITPELTENLGRVLHVAVAGLLDVLRSREQIKGEIGMRSTTFKPVDNNPLKFSANVEDALHNLFIKRNKAYLQPAEAFEDAFHEVRNHQLAMLAATKAVFRNLVATFEPQRLQDEFDLQAKNNSLIPALAKLRHWESYRAKFGNLAGDPDETFRTLFEDKFADAYSEHLARLKAATPAPAVRKR